MEKINTRTIMIFPEFDNGYIIDDIRKEYDPLANLVRPHITIVFPFEDSISNVELMNIIDNRLKGIKPFDIELKDFTKCEDRFGNYLFLNVSAGSENISKIHDILYHNEFTKFDIGVPYVPHMTVGKVESKEKLENAYEKVRGIAAIFRTNVNKISVEMIGENEESIIVIEKRLA